MYSLGVSSPENKEPSLFNEYKQQYGKDLPRADAASKFYAGCFGHVKVEIYPLPRDDGNRIACAVLGVMFAEDGEPLSGGTGLATVDDFAGFAKAPIDAEDLL